MLAFEEVAQRLDGAGVQWAVFAGVAATVYGATRPLTDIDVLVPASDGARVQALFPEAKVKHRGEGTLGLELPGIDILAGLAQVDLDERMATRVTRHEVAGITVPVIPPEDNILLKAMWGRGEAEGKHDWEDVEAMMACLVELDWEYLRWRAEQLVPRERVKQVLERLARLRDQTAKA